MNLEERLKHHPQLHKRIESLVNIVEDADGDLDKANAAEERIIQELQQMGREAIEYWAKEKEQNLTDNYLKNNKDNKNIKIKNKGKKEIHWHTTFGEISIYESRFTEDNKLYRPFSYSAEVYCRAYSAPLQRRMTDFGADDSFAKAVAKMEEHYGITVPASAMRRITEKHAEAIKTIPLDTGISAQNGNDYIIGETDGTMIPIVDCSKTTDKNNEDSRKNRTVFWKEGRLCLAFTQGSVTPFFSATMGKPDETGDHLFHAAINAGLGHNSSVHCVGDGAKWIANQVDRVFSTQGSYLIDYFHLCEYLAPATGMNGSNKPTYDDCKKMVKGGNISEVVKLLRPNIEPTEIADKNAPVRKCIRYIENRPSQFDYPNAIKNDLPIGSGQIESAHRYVIQERLKLTGAWWRKDIADNMLALRTLRANNLWDEYWADDSIRQAA